MWMLLKKIPYLVCVWFNFG